MVSLTNENNNLVNAGRASLWLWTMKCTVQELMPNRPWVKHSGTDLGPMALAGLRPDFGQRGWNHGPHRLIEVCGPSGPGDPCAVHLEFKILFYNGIFIKIELIKIIKVWICWPIILLYKWQYYITTQRIKFNSKHIFHRRLWMNFIFTSSNSRNCIRSHQLKDTD